MQMAEAHAKEDAEEEEALLKDCSSIEICSEFSALLRLWASWTTCRISCEDLVFKCLCVMTLPSI
jgi:hypothetical protein